MFFDIDGLRDDMEDDCYGAFFGGGYGGAPHPGGGAEGGRCR